MPMLKIICDGTVSQADPPLDPANAIITESDITVVGMPNGMQSGDPSVLIRIPLGEGREVIAETSLRLFYTAGRALKAHYETFHGFKE